MLQSKFQTKDSKLKLFIMKATIVAILALAVMVSYRYLTTAVQHDISFSENEDGVRTYYVDGVQYNEDEFKSKGFKSTILE